MPINRVQFQRKPRELPALRWIHTVLGTLETAIDGAHKAFRFRTYANPGLGAFCHRFNHRLERREGVRTLISDCILATPVRQKTIRGTAELRA